ncbi:hypothetical protein C8Q80DRAFT_848958 [Daedaleopsis nitida]|nr:hypothetical protein C8Q80DRAFT_848958 [Daedaleopsis nitida]
MRRPFAFMTRRPGALTNHGACILLSHDGCPGRWVPVRIPQSRQAALRDRMRRANGRAKRHGGRESGTRPRVRSARFQPCMRRNGVERRWVGGRLPCWCGSGCAISSGACEQDEEPGWK